MALRKFTVALTGIADGSGTAYSPYLTGYLKTIEYVKTDYVNGVDFTITAEATGETLWTEANVNAATIRYPRAATQTPAGAAALYAGGGLAVNDQIGMARDRVKIVIAQSGATKSGSFVIVVDDQRRFL